MFWLFLRRENDTLCIFCSFLKRNSLNQNLHNLSDFEWKKITTRENLNWNFCNASDFDIKFNIGIDLEMENFRDVWLRKITCIQKITFWFFLLCENDILCIFCFVLKKAWFWNENFTTCEISNWEKYNATEFELKNNASDLEMKI